MWIPWNLVRNPLVPSVPLEGSDTVQGLRTLERLRAADLLSHSGDADEKRKTKRASRRSRYQRYKGPFIEYLGVDALTQGDGKPWKEFGGQQVGRREMDGRCFDVSGSLDLLAERIDVRFFYLLSFYLLSFFLEVFFRVFFICHYSRTAGSSCYIPHIIIITIVYMLFVF